MQMESDAAREKALQEIGPYLAYADRTALSEGRSAEVAARVAKRLRRWRMLITLGLGFIAIHNLVQLLWDDPSAWYVSISDLLSVVSMAIALTLAFVYPRDRRLQASIERGAFSGPPLQGAAAERSS